MILDGLMCKVRFKKSGGIDGNSKLKKPLYIVQCDKCNKIFEETQVVFDNRINLINFCYCGKCARPLMSSLAGYKGSHNEDGSIKANKGHFSRERVDAMNPEEYKHYCKQRKTASRVFHKRLEDDPEYKDAHYKKVFNNSKIGYISRGQRQIWNLLKDDGFLLEYQIGAVRGDIVNPIKKIVVEYHGDFWHANPGFYKPTDYMTVIKMTAKEKWAKDRNRRFYLRSKGWTIITIWENKWKNDKMSVLKDLEKLQSKDWVEFAKYTPLYDVKTKKMKNTTTDKNKYVLIEEVDQHLQLGWEFGHIKRG